MERRMDGTQPKGETPLPTLTPPFEMTFDKSDPEGSGTWSGVVAGDLEGTVVSRVTVLDQSQPVWLVEVRYDVAAAEGELTVRVAGSLDTASGAVRAHGAVTEGIAEGAAAKVMAQNVDAARSRFKGTIRVGS